MTGLLWSTAAAEAAEAQPSYWTDTIFKKFIKADFSYWLMLLALVLVAAIFFTILRGKKAWTTNAIAYGALSIALSFVLSYIRIFRMPQGGSITPASMLPLMLFSAAFGVGPGVTAGVVYGVLQYLQGGDFLNIWQMLFDYIIAFAALGLAGVYKYLQKRWQIYLTLALSAAVLIVLLIAYPNVSWLLLLLFAALAALTVFVLRDPEKYGMLPAMGVAVLARAVSAVIAGLMWVAAYPVEGQAPIVYSIVYNAAYLLPELVICMVIAGLIGNRMLRMMKSAQ